LKYLKLKARVAIVAFNVEAFDVFPLKPVENNIDAMIDKIERLSPNGGTLIHTAVERATQLLSSRPGSNFIIIISDGKTKLPKQTINAIKEARKKGIRTYTIGVGKDTHVTNMKAFAEAGGGQFLQPGEMQNLRLSFERPMENEEGMPIDRYQLEIIDSNHFITKSL